MVVMITGIDLSQEIFVINVLRILKSSLKHCRKHVLRSLQLYGDQALWKPGLVTADSLSQNQTKKVVLLYTKLF